MRHLIDAMAECEAPPPEAEKAWREVEAQKRRKRFKVIPQKESGNDPS